MAGNGDGREISPESSGPLQRTASSSERLRTRVDPFLVVCRIFSFVTALTAVLCIVVNILSAIRTFRSGSDIFDGIFRCYAVVLALVVVVAETEWEFFIRQWKVLEYWVGRGMLQIFVAVMTRAFPDYSISSVAVMTRAFPDYSMEQNAVILLENIASYLLLSCGAVYVISGILCIGCLKRARRQKEITRGQAVKDLEEMERRREELEQLLAQERV